MRSRLQWWIKGRASTTSTTTPLLFCLACYFNVGLCLLLHCLYREQNVCLHLCICLCRVRIKLNIGGLFYFGRFLRAFARIIRTPHLLWSSSSCICSMVPNAVRKAFRMQRRGGESFDYIFPLDYFYSHNTAHWQNCSLLLYFKLPHFWSLVGSARHAWSKLRPGLRWRSMARHPSNIPFRLQTSSMWTMWNMWIQFCIEHIPLDESNVRTCCHSV